MRITEDNSRSELARRRELLLLRRGLLRCVEETPTSMKVRKAMISRLN
jgi:hypothetical protein